MVEDTSKRPPGLHVLGAIGAGFGGYIEDMEAAGTRQLERTELLPAAMSPEDPAAWTALGFTLGDVADDPLFRHAAIPSGWHRQEADDPRGGYLLDERGIRRVEIFYKAALYDRRADMTLVNVGRHLVTQAVYGDGEPAVDWKPLTADERADLIACLRRYVADAERHPSIYGDRLPRAEAILATAPEAPAPGQPDNPRERPGGSNPVNHRTGCDTHGPYAGLICTRCVGALPPPSAPAAMLATTGPIPIRRP
jgi:hypothetical protein